MAKNLPPLRLLSVFEAVLRTGGVRAAAQELNVTQPAISQALRQLEDHVGARLLDRRTRPAARTQAGEILEAAVVDGLGRIADAVEQIRGLEAAGHAVTIACSVGVATYWLMPRLARFSALQPHVAVNVMTTPQGAPRLTPSIDLAIRYGLGQWGDGLVELLFPERVAPVCSPAFLSRLMDEAGGDPIRLDRAPLIHVRAEDPTWLGWPAFLKQRGLPEPISPGRQFTNYVQATQAALDGQGVMLGWQSITGGLMREGRLVAATSDQVVPREGFYLVSAFGAGEREAARLLKDWLLGEG
ncbi:LysR family glycine cleavage system transcriptional activator [Rhizobium sp. SG_E_25_P2]|uniref:LysR substrate-binding domain-containing protein n=1 Tax=Rhizobium sp. SG_E_25_P2 TaxID=2879942 RepID=UPI002473180C|nr:LysR substrate-binding domain-containing protein [Rhizobium sp. SG_E_25_P2]MDH6266594.1 LysR family glycine cleavage system transcriptional activator [Rhizobium sp. SG_E_25_P2]